MISDHDGSGRRLVQANFGAGTSSSIAASRVDQDQGLRRWHGLGRVEAAGTVRSSRSPPRHTAAQPPLRRIAARRSASVSSRSARQRMATSSSRYTATGAFRRGDQHRPDRPTTTSTASSTPLSTPPKRRLINTIIAARTMVGANGNTIYADPRSGPRRAPDVPGKLDDRTLEDPMTRFTPLSLSPSSTVDPRPHANPCGSATPPTTLSRSSSVESSCAEYDFGPLGLEIIEAMAAIRRIDQPSSKRVPTTPSPIQIMDFDASIEFAMIPWPLRDHPLN